MTEYAGQAVAMVIADTQEHANQMAKAVSVKYGDSSGKPILTIEDAIKANSFYPSSESPVRIGDADGKYSDIYIPWRNSYSSHDYCNRCNIAF